MSSLSIKSECVSSSERRTFAVVAASWPFYFIFSMYSSSNFLSIANIALHAVKVCKFFG